MSSVTSWPRSILFVFLLLLAACCTRAATISALFNTGVGTNGQLLASGSIDPHWQIIQSADLAFPGPAARVLNDTGFPIPPWLANGPASKWIAPQADQSTGNQPGDYHYRISFDLTGLEPGTAVISGQWTSDNGGSAVLLNGVNTGLSGDGNFPALGNAFTITNGFIDGVNTLEFVVNNAPPNVNPTGFRCELTGTADAQPPPGTPPTIVSQPVSVSIGSLDPATFSVVASGSRPFNYQWRREGSPIAGANGSSYTIASARGPEAGRYDVVVSNSAGSVTSAVAILTITLLSPAQLSYEPPGASSRRTGLTFSEIMYHPAPDAAGRHTEFIEIYNSNPFIEDIGGWRLTGDFDYTFPSNTVLQGNSYLVVAPVPADVEAVYHITGVLGGSTNQLPNDGGTIRLRKRSGAVVLEVQYSDQPPWPVAADGTGHSLVLVRPSYGENDPRAWAHSAFKGGSPGAPDPVPAGPLENVVINEFLANTDPGLNDYVELFNNSSVPLDLSGTWLSDDPATNKFQLPAGTRLDPRGFVVFDETALGFSLRSEGETIYLVSSNGSRVLDAVRFGGQANGIASGRYPDGAPGFQELRARTPGTTNAPARLRDVVINEIYYNPLSGNDEDEFVELYNRGNTAADLAGWRFTSGINFTFPDHTSIAPGGYVVVTKNSARLLTNYPGLNASIVYGNFGGNLANGSEHLALGQPERNFITNGTAIITNVFYIAADEVTYVDGGRWGRWADGGGSSLELIDPHSDNRAASNWGDSDETSKAPWTVVEATGVVDVGAPAPLSQPGPADHLQIMLLGAGEALVDDVEVLVGGANRVSNSSFEGGTTGWIFGGTHSKTSLENSGYNSSRSLHLRASTRGDNTVNRLSVPLTSAVAVGATATLRAKVRWLRGHPEILLRLKGNYLETVGRLTVPPNLGTPGAPNSVARANAGPSITEVAHRPVLPQAGQSIRITARVADPDNVTSVVARYRIDGQTGLFSAPMLDDGNDADALAGDGIYTGVIPGQTNGKLVAFRVEAVDGFSPPATNQFPADAPTRECLVRVGDVQPPGAFAVYRLWLTAATVNTWSTREKLSNEDLDATFVYGNTRAIYNAGAHYSGSPYTVPIYNSPVGALCGYDISMPQDDLFLGSAHTLMDWPIRDETDQREQLMFWLLDQAGLPNMYRRYVIMYVNGNRRGVIYDDIQQPNGETVDEWFPDDNEGSLFKTDCWDEFTDAGDREEPSCKDLNSLELYTSGGARKNVRYRWVWRPRAIHGTANDYTDLFNLIDAANAPANRLVVSMENLADMEHWMRTFAANDLPSYWDAFGNPNAKNTFLYKPERGTWKLMCWDMDVGLGQSTVSLGAESPTAPLFNDLNDDRMDVVYQQAVWLRHYWRAIQEAVNTYFQPSAVNALITSKYNAFQASGLALTSPFVPSGGGGGAPARSIPDWITQRRTFLLSQLNTVAASFNVTTPNNFSTNRNLLILSGTAPVAVYTFRINGIEYRPNWSTVTIWNLQLPISAGLNVLDIVGLDRFGNTISNKTINVTYTGSDEDAADNVVINEIMYNPVLPEASYVEIFNRSTNYAFNVTGWRLHGVDFTFPQGTIISPRGFLVVCKNRAAFGQAYGYGLAVLGPFDGQLDDGGETLSLFRPSPTPGTEILVDRVTYDDDPPWPANADGHGAALQLVDAEQDNNRVSNWADGSGWKFLSYTDTVGASGLTRLSLFLESSGGDVYLDDISLVPGNVPGVGPNVLGNGDFEAADASLQPWAVGPLGTNSAIVTNVFHAGKACLHLVVNAGVQSLTTFYQDFPEVQSNAIYTLSFWYLSGNKATNLNVRMNPSFRVALNPTAALFTPGAPNGGIRSLLPFPPLWLSEIQPQNLTTLADNFGDNDPWIELYNSGNTPLALDGFSLANTYSQLDQWAFPAGNVINPGQFLLIWADGEPQESAGAQLHANFRLNPTSGSVVLSRLLAGTPQILDYINYANVGPDRSFGSYPDGQLSYRQTFNFPTPRGANNPSAPPVTLFINEWMAANTGSVLDPADQDPDDWFEIYNPNNTAVDLTGYHLTDDPMNSEKFTVPARITVPARGFLLVWADEESSQTCVDGDLHVNFKLSQGGEFIGLYSPTGQLVDSISFLTQTNDISQGRWPDGASAPFYFMPTPTPRGPNVVPTTGPRITSLEFVGGGTVRLTWSALPGTRYQLQYKDDLGLAAWTAVTGDVIAAANTASKEDRPTGTQRFYRVIEVP